MRRGRCKKGREGESEPLKSLHLFFFFFEKPLRANMEVENSGERESGVL